MTAPRRPTERLDLVGLRDIAALLEVDKRTPTQWRQRNVLPPEDGYISGTFPCWHRKTILRWAQQTGRLPQRKELQDAATAAAAEDTADAG